MRSFHQIDIPEIEVTRDLLKRTQTTLFGITTIAHHQWLHCLTHHHLLSILCRHLQGTTMVLLCPTFRLPRLGQQIERQLRVHMRNQYQSSFDAQVTVAENMNGSENGTFASGKESTEKEDKGCDLAISTLFIFIILYSASWIPLT